MPELNQNISTPIRELSESNACLHLLDDLVSKLFDVLEVKRDTEITATVLVEQLRY